MARVGRLAGALLAESEGRYFLVGDLKEPCDFAAQGLSDPGPIEPLARHWVELFAHSAFALRPPWLVLEREGEGLAELLWARLVIPRNGSVSERLWTLIVGEDEAVQEVPARWLGEIPAALWDAARDSVLRCR